MKVVLDTNVLISGVYWSGPPSEILARWKEGKFQLLISPDILDEYTNVADRMAKKRGVDDIKPLIDLITLNSLIVQPGKRPVPACDDPNDVMFLAAAIAGRASHIVSGDRALLRVDLYPGGTVITPRQFLNKL